MHFLISPTLAQLPEDKGRITNSRLGEVGARVFPFVSLLALVLGILRGTVFGRIQSFEAVTTTYGIVWLVAMVLTIAIIMNNARFIGPTFAGLKDAPDYRGSIERLQSLTRIDLALFTVVFTCMILMRFMS
jgi:hypothetical protein